MKPSSLETISRFCPDALSRYKASGFSKKCGCKVYVNGGEESQVCQRLRKRQRMLSGGWP